jgi:riboflavin kinase/FMN adenylyltransferase
LAERSCITVGTFDGVHLGHQKVIQELLEHARARGERSVLITFDPHPLYIVKPQIAPRLLTTRADKDALLETFGIDDVAFIPFTKELSQLEPAQFVQQILIDRYGLSHLIIGYDHGFGRGRSGDVDTLKKIGADTGFEVDVVEPHKDHGENVSSSHIRAQLQAGDVASAAAGLGRAYSLSGVVVHGDGRGAKELGMATANLSVSDSDKLIPFEGIYAVRANGMGGVMHVGPRPTIPGAGPALEVHVFDFSGDLYGSSLTVEFVARVRGVERFSSMEALARQMHLDAKEARRILAETGPRGQGAGGRGPGAGF